MGQRKRILVACGTALASSKVVAKEIEEALKARGLDVTTHPCRASDVARSVSGIDLVLTTSPISGNIDIPMVQTLAFLTGVGKESAIQQIVKVLGN